jgi:uncharacterized repeat protein (TIGR01451 family)
MSKSQAFARSTPFLVLAVLLLVLMLILGGMEAAAAPSGAPALVITVTPTPTYTLTPTPTATVTPTPTPTPPRDTVSRSPCDLVITKRVEPTEVQPGDEVLFTIEVTNKGQQGAVNTFVIDDIPEYLEILDVDTSQGTWRQEGQKIIVDIGVIGQDYVVVILIYTRVRDDAPAPLTLENVATARSDNCPDPQALAVLRIVGEPAMPVTGGLSTWWLLAAILGTGLVAVSLALSRRSQV